MEIKRFSILLLLSNLLISQEIVPRYWNSLSTHVTVGVPLVDDESLIGGRIQVRVNFNDGSTFTDLGQIHVIEKGDIDDVCLLYTSPSPRDRQKSRMPSSA